MGDLDGDGDLDLVTPWVRGEDRGWLLAFNDGSGRFGRPRAEQFSLSDNPVLPFVGGGDLDGDGRMDLVLNAGDWRPQVWFNEEEGWVVRELGEDLAPAQVADFDGDGDGDLWMYTRDPLFGTRLWFNDGAGRFQEMIPELPGAGRVRSGAHGASCACRASACFIVGAAF